MGIPHFIKNFVSLGAKLPFKTSFPDLDNLLYTENDKNISIINEYKNIGFGKLKYIGIDGSVIIHSQIVTDNKLNVNHEQSCIKIVNKIIFYIENILKYFKVFNDSINDNNDSKIILHIVIDGLPPIKKNRKYSYNENNEEVKDAYSKMINEDKDVLHIEIIDKLKKYLDEQFVDKFHLLSNHTVNSKNRGEGEIELYRFCKKLNEKYNEEDNNKHVIISNDSDVIALMLLNQDKNMVVISPLKETYITNFNLIIDKLKLHNKEMIVKYVLLHFIFFGSDYNLGLVCNPDENKQNIIMKCVQEGINDIDEIGNMFKRKRKRRESVDDIMILEKLKQLLIYEAICSIMYYIDPNVGINYLTDYSPQLYRYKTAKKLRSLIQFSDIFQEID